ncbi:hypothetical protein GOP47_0000085 [Adiantum capillus-veneris]|uniref:Lipid II flippase MurJ n=1 Tax=Adiantum capillus-veneris TaxID=13818 RepID=A0A9D4VE18_ADICA|nr:hypothetical protein GOP47_0000085 [Adiantum capillus-veneris]
MHTTTTATCHILVVGHPYGAKGIAMQQQGTRRRERQAALSGPQLLCCANMEPNTPPIPSLAPRRPKETSNLLQVAASIGLATTLSKALGLLREALLAAVFGVGPVMSAFSYSSMLPGFFMAVLGGINGPLQVTVLSFISKHEETEGRLLAGKLSTAICLICGGLSLAIFLFSGAIIDTTAPGLLTLPNGSVTRNLAILQLKIMAPCTLLSGLIGVGFGTLSAAGVYEILALSPIISNLSVIAGVVVYLTLSKSGKTALRGAISLALGVTIGAFGQWIWQAKAQQELGLKFLPFHSVNPLKDRDLQEVLRMLLPAILGSSMLQLATLTDMYFASFIPGAAAGLGYAYLMVMAPLGILSSAILLPMSSLFARLLEPSKRAELKSRVGEGLLVLLAATLPITAVVLSLSKPLVEVALQRSAFDSSASILVSSLVACYVAGSFASLARDLLTQLFYALGEGYIPCWINMIALFINAILDWKLVHIGPVGLVLATIFANGFSVLALLILLSNKLQGLPFKQWILSSLKMIGASIVSGLITKFTYSWLTVTFIYIRVFQVVKVCSLVMAGFMGVVTFSVALYVFGQTELELLLRLCWSQMNYQTDFV